MKKTLLILCYFLSVKCFSQNSSTLTAGTDKYDDLYSVTQLSDGNYIAAGYTQKKDAQGNNYVVKIDSNGQFVWGKIVGADDAFDKGSTVISTKDKGFAICGSLNNTMALYKFNSTGVLKWSKEYDNIFNVTQGTCLLQDGQGQFLIGGTINGYTGSPGGSYLVKTNASGDPLWSKRYFDVHFSNINDLKKTKDKNYIFLTVNTNDLQPDSTYIIKTDTSGNVLWSRKFYSTNGAVRGFNILPTSDKGYLITGTNYSSDATHGFLLKLDAEGNLLWSKSVDDDINAGTYLQAAVETSSGDYIAAGSGYSADSSFYYLIKVNSSGILKWAKTIRNNSKSKLYSLIRTKDKGYLATGDYAGSEENDLYDYYFLKLDDKGNSCNPQGSYGSLQDFGTLTNATVPVYSINSSSYNYAVDVTTSGTTTSICSVLAVNLVSFNATLQNSIVQLQWKTTQQNNTAYFTVQKSDDGRQFSDLKQVFVSANSTTLITYNAVDNNPLQGKSFYRLKMVDKDGAINYSAVVSVENIIPNLISIAPNPVMDILNVKIESSINAKAFFVIADVSGKTLLQKNVILTKGSNNITFNVQQFAKSVYMVKIINDNEVQTLKWVKK
jgi:hypothetical protein